MRIASWHYYVVEVILFFLIIFGVLPREFAFALAGLLVAYTLFASLEDATVMFVRSIPLFIALPITTSFDNFNTWRIIAIIIFLKWLWTRPKISFSIPLIALFVISLLSVFVAQDTTAAILRVIYFVNLSLVPIVIYHLPNKHRIINAFIPPFILVLAVGFFQLATTYFMDIYQFVDFWGWGAQCRQFGMEWCKIAVEQGNTWFAYNAFGQINLRMFSLFTDSHTFPMYILMALPAVFVWLSPSRPPPYGKGEAQEGVRHWPSVIIPFAFLATILSNTRGIWLAGWVVSIQAFRRGPARWLLVFLLLFAFVYPISATPQFHLGWQATLGNRIKSILNLNETSNALRIAIWKDSARSMLSHPLLGVGIGNFPVVLDQSIDKAKAGSSAHNVYLHIGAELGIPALLIFLWLMWITLKKIYKKSDQPYFAALLIFVPWVMLYLMTDSALFDERAFLAFCTLCATIHS